MHRKKLAAEIRHECENDTNCNCDAQLLIFGSFPLFLGPALLMLMLLMLCTQHGRMRRLERRWGFERVTSRQ